MLEKDQKHFSGPQPDSVHGLMPEPYQKMREVAVNGSFLLNLENSLYLRRIINDS